MRHTDSVDQASLRVSVDIAMLRILYRTGVRVVFLEAVVASSANYEYQ